MQIGEFLGFLKLFLYSIPCLYCFKFRNTVGEKPTENLSSAGLREGCRPRGPTARRPVSRWMPCAPYKEPAGPLPLALFARDPPRLIHNSHSFSPYKVWYRTDTRKHLTGPGLVSALIGRPFLLLAIELWPRGYSLLRRTWTPPLCFRGRSSQPVLWTQRQVKPKERVAQQILDTFQSHISKTFGVL